MREQPPAVRHLLTRIRQTGLPEPTLEYQFDETRRWRFDLAWLDRLYPVAVEINGGTWARKGAERCPVCGQVPVGRHVTGKGYENDREKINAATERGWRVFEYTTRQVLDDEAIEQLERVLIRK
jgi:hypothetical protein